MQKKRILLVEDELDMRELIKSALRSEAHVTESNNGAEAMTIFEPDHFDLVMTDHRMPFMTGAELAEKIKKIAPSQPILMITGRCADTDESESVDTILRKPFAMESLRTAVIRLLAAPRAAAA
jgi:CheY-like chemotaxis protein